MLLDFSGNLKVADFGLARVRPEPLQSLDEESSRNQSVSGSGKNGSEKAFSLTAECGSYRYMAPEVFRHEPYTEKCDVYSFAMIAYHILTLKPPFNGLNGVDAAKMASLDFKRPSLSSVPGGPQ